MYLIWRIYTKPSLSFLRIIQFQCNLLYSFMEMLSSPTEEEHKGAGSSSSDSDVELAGDGLPELG